MSLAGPAIQGKWEVNDMKTTLAAALLALLLTDAQAQFTPPDQPEQTVNVTAGGVTDGRHVAGNGGSLSAHATGSGTNGAGQSYSASGSASTSMGAGFLTGSIASSFSGAGSSSASLSAYSRDVMTFERKDGGSDSSLLVEYSIVLTGGKAGGTTGGITGGGNAGGASNAAAAGDAGMLDWTFVHRLDDFYTTAWGSSSTLGYDGGLKTSTIWWSQMTERVFGVFTFTARVGAGLDTELEFYLQMESQLNAQGVDASGFISANAPTIYWGGISRVTDMNGQLVDYSVTSASGLDYRLSVAPSPTPEPATWAMLLTGAGLLAAWGRRRRHAGVAPAFSRGASPTTI